MLGLRVVHRDDRELQHAGFSIARSRITPVVVSSVLPMISAAALIPPRPGADDGVEVVEQGEKEQREHEVGAVVHRDLRVVVERRRDVP